MQGYCSALNSLSYIHKYTYTHTELHIHAEQLIREKRALSLSHTHTHTDSYRTAVAQGAQKMAGDMQTHCNTLQHTATHSAIHCNTLQHTPQQTATHCNMHTYRATVAQCARTMAEVVLGAAWRLAFRPPHCCHGMNVCMYVHVYVYTYVYV